MITTILALSLLAGGDLTCTVTGEPLNGSKLAFDVAGVRAALCCGGCAGLLTNDPSGTLKRAFARKATFAESLFDPTTGVKVDAKKAKVTADRGGIRYRFVNQAAADAFLASKEAPFPTKEALYCPVMKHSVKSWADAGAFADFEGVRYALCCPACLAEFKQDPAKFAPGAASFVRPLQAVAVKKG